MWPCEVGQNDGVTTCVLFAGRTFPVASGALRGTLPQATVEVIDLGDGGDGR